MTQFTPADVQNFKLLDAGFLRTIGGADPAFLPTIRALPDAQWPGPARRDGRNRIVMNESAAQWLRARLPLVVIAYKAGIHTDFRIALEPHHLAGGVNDRAAPATDATAAKEQLRQTFRAQSSAELRAQAEAREDPDPRARAERALAIAAANADAERVEAERAKGDAEGAEDAA
jgi:hypothetical protein